MSRQHLGQKSGQGSCLGSGSLLLKQTRPVTVPLLCFFFFNPFSVFETGSQGYVLH